MKNSIKLKGSLGDRIELIITSDDKNGINDLCLWIDETDGEWKVRSHSNLTAENVSIRKNKSIHLKNKGVAK